LYSPSCSLFFFHGHLTHRPLPSFPTRRSSDLAFRCPVAARIVDKNLAHELGGNGKEMSAALPLRTAHPDQAKVRLMHQRGALVQDRKSTRLNSSHLGISYAVFCLKKKKHDTLH